MALEAGRKEVLDRSMFELKRFDSAEYFSSGEKSSYLKDLSKSNKASMGRIKRLDVGKGSGSTAYSSDYSTVSDCANSRASSLSEKTESYPTTKKQMMNVRVRQVAESEAGKRVLLERKIRQLRRFDSGDYFLGRKTDEEIVANKPLTVNVDSDSEDELRTKKQLREKKIETRRHSAKLAQRFLKKKGVRKRWDSGDYNALLTTGSPSSEGTPDLDTMSVSSAEQSDGYCSHETKSEEPVHYESDNSLTKKDSFIHEQSVSPRGDNSNSKCSRSRSSSSILSKLPYYSALGKTAEHGPVTDGLPPTPPRSTIRQTEKKQGLAKNRFASPVAMAQSAAKKHFGRHQKRSKRFDSADYFRGLSPPSQECEADSFKELGSPTNNYKSTGTTLGASTLVQRQIRAEKLRKERSNVQ
eukprot:CAMPEP_0203757954 /NCGR_PEP_ID=MMETSP0098-20131031/10774_1 /ASSEMBLY_ACC=CAM_ASM_000208 /TAXON_ID=96639 /ORGANISM=" , Strain NY0313808BC1" /LENGTH=411 /DNA_ID=CAMNT_0050650199 /DNA_START=364 /DNA_END=1598 /DNA_ORIENTATION=-